MGSEETTRVTRFLQDSSISDATELSFTIHADGTILQATPQFAQLLQRKQANLIGRNIKDILHEEDTERIRHELTKANVGKRIRFLLPSQELSVFLKEVVPLPDSMIISVAPSWEQCEFVVFDNLEKLLTLDTGTSEVICDLYGHVLCINESFEKLYGWKLDEIKGKRAPILSPTQWSEFREIKNRILEGERMIWKQTICMTKNGVMLPIQLLITPLLDETGSVHAFSAISNNIAELIEITALVEMQMSELLKRETLLQDITNNVEVGICQFDIQKGRYIYISPAVERILRLKEEDLYSDPTIVYTNCIEEDVERLQNFYSNASVKLREIEYCINVAEEGVIWIRTKLTPITDENGDIIRFITISRDITEQKKQYELLSKWDKLNMVGRLAAGVAHEVRNPLTTIKGFIQLLSKETGNRYSQVIFDELVKIELILNEFLLLAKPSNSTGFEVASLSCLLHRTVSLLTSQASLYNVKITLNHHAPTAFIYCESKQIKQVLINLLKNAIEAMPNGGEIVITSTEMGDGNVKISIEDNGIGIPPDRLIKLGEPFYSNKEKGTGLGLMISYKIIEHHNGSIHYKSEEGVGTIVEVLLPLAQEEQLSTSLYDLA